MSVRAISGREQRSQCCQQLPFFRCREGRSPSVPIWSEVDTRTHILNRDIAKHKVLIYSASSVQTHRKPSVHFRQTDLRS